MTDDIGAFGYIPPTTQDDKPPTYAVVDTITDRVLDEFHDEQSALEYASRENNAFIGELRVQEANR